MQEIEIQKVKTAHGELQWYRDDAITMINPKTIELYKELRYGAKAHPDGDEHGVFFAFSKEQFYKGYKKLVERGFIKQGDNIVDIGNGGYCATKELAIKFFNYYKEINKRIAKQCDPQEVYYYEYNQCECSLAHDDEDAYNTVVDFFGEELAKSVKRLSW